MTWLTLLAKLLVGSEYSLKRYVLKRTLKFVSNGLFLAPVISYRIGIVLDFYLEVSTFWGPFALEASIFFPMDCSGTKLAL